MAGLGYTASRKHGWAINEVSHDSTNESNEAIHIEGMILSDEDREYYYISKTERWYGRFDLKVKKPYSSYGKPLQKRKVLGGTKINLGEFCNLISCHECGIIINKEDSFSACDYGFQSDTRKIAPMTKHIHDCCKSCADSRNETVRKEYTEYCKWITDRNEKRTEKLRDYWACKRAEKAMGYAMELKEVLG
jgi:hypothetical protein